jgi:hypothetical protein
MSKPKGDEINQEPNTVTSTLATSTLALIVTPEIRAAMERKRLTRQKARLLGEDLHASEIGEVDLGDIDE